MPQNNHLQNLISLNLAILFISTSGVLGKYIDMPVPVIIGFRALFACVLLFLFCKWKKLDLKILSKDRWAVFWGGLFMGLHWVMYFYSLKLSNVAIGMLSIFTYPVITTFLEPLILKTKFQKVHLLLGILVLVGISLLVPDFDLKNDYTKAVGLGVASAFVYSLRNLILQPKVQAYNGSALMLYQLLIITVCMAPFLFLMDSSGIAEQWSATILLALLTTAIGHTMFLYSFKHFSITTASIISSMQPIYGIIMGIIFLKEYPELTTLIGGALILLSVIIESVRTYSK